MIMPEERCHKNRKPKMKTSQIRNASKSLDLFSGLEKMPNPCFFAPLWLHHIPRHQKPQDC